MQFPPHFTARLESTALYRLRSPTWRMNSKMQLNFSFALQIAAGKIAWIYVWHLWKLVDTFAAIVARSHCVRAHWNFPWNLFRPFRVPIAIVLSPQSGEREQKWFWQTVFGCSCLALCRAVHTMHTIALVHFSGVWLNLLVNSFSCCRMEFNPIQFWLWIDGLSNWTYISFDRYKISW